MVRKCTSGPDSWAVSFEMVLKCCGGFPQLEIPDWPLGGCRNRSDTVQRMDGEFHSLLFGHNQGMNAAGGDTRRQPQTGRSPSTTELREQPAQP